MKQPHQASHRHRGDVVPGFLEPRSGSFFGAFTPLRDFWS